MKKISKILIFLFLTTFTFTGCDDLLDVDSERLVFTDEYQFNAANDSLYSMFGIFSQLQKITDSYVLLGELRGDLIDLPNNSNEYLTQINDFNYSKDNPYMNNIKDYYAVINNCNYVIHNIDTTKLKGAIPVMTRIYAATKAIRAWTYMQIALNFGKTVFYDKPILTLEDAQKTYPTYNSIEDLAPVLIADIAPYKDVEEPGLGSYAVNNIKDSFFPIRFILGDLYLWTGQYENAANEYYGLIYKEKYIVNGAYSTRLQVVNNEFTGAYSINPNWGNIFDYSSPEYISSIATSNEHGHFTNLDSLNLNGQIIPSDIALNNWNSQMYYESATLDTLGDQRKISSVAYVEKTTYTSTGFYFQTNYYTTKPNVMYKYVRMNPLDYNIKQVMPYRVALLYLRYAEALNRMGKPNTAFAVLKYGLNRTNLLNKKIIPNKELIRTITQTTIKSVVDPLVDSLKYDTTYVAPSYMNFNETSFANNAGVRTRGCGKVNTDTTYYVIPTLASQTDSILFVEDKIENELTLELAFEGNRFQDLVRIATRRNDNAYLADKIAAKHKNNKEAIRSKLLNRENWYLKFD